MVSKLALSVERARRSRFYDERLRGFEVRSLEDFRALPLTTRGDLEAAGLDGLRAVPLDRVCHYGETSGTTGAPNSTWLTAGDFSRSAKAIASRHPDVFAPGRIILNRFPFMAAPAHLIQLIAQHGGGVAIPAGNINWDVPFPKALDLAERTGAQVLAGLPLEPLVLAQIARDRGLEPAKATNFDTFFLGGSALPPTLQTRVEKLFGARVIELYGSTETMLLGTSCSKRSLHLETELAHCEILKVDSNKLASEGEEGRLVVTTLAIEGSPLIRFDTGDLVRLQPTCACGDERPAIVVLGRGADVVELGGRRMHSAELIEAGAAAADALDSSIFFVVVLDDRLVIRVEDEGGGGDALAAARKSLGDVPIEIDTVEPKILMDTEQMGRSPSVYKPVLVSDWRRPGRRVLGVSEGMIEWPRLAPSEVWRWVRRMLKTSWRRRALVRSQRVADDSSR